MNIKNTNITLKDGQSILWVVSKEDKFGPVSMVITSSDKETLKKYSSLGFQLFASPLFYHDHTFYALNKKLNQVVRGGRQVVVNNGLRLIENHICQGGIVHIEVTKQNQQVNPIFSNILNSFAI